MNSMLWVTFNFVVCKYFQLDKPKTLLSGKEFVSGLKDKMAFARVENIERKGENFGIWHCVLFPKPPF